MGGARDRGGHSRSVAPTFARHARLGRILTRCVGRLRAFDFDEFLPGVAHDLEGAAFEFAWAK